MERQQCNINARKGESKLKFARLLVWMFECKILSTEILMFNIETICLENIARCKIDKIK